MPNYFYNAMTIAKSDAKKYVLDQNEDGEFYVNFNKIIPMPSEIENTSYGSTNNPDIYWFLSNKGVKSIDEVISNPDIVAIDCGFTDIRNAIERAEKTCKNQQVSEYYGQDSNYEMGKLLIDNFHNYGVTNWYDWANKYWGTKWNAWDTEIIDYDDETYQILFVTAWCPPTSWLNKLAILCDFYLSGRDEFSDTEFDVGITAIDGKLG